MHLHIQPKNINNLVLKSVTGTEKNKEVLLLGDFDTDLIKANLNSKVSELVDIAYSSYLIRPHYVLHQINQQKPYPN